MSLVRGRDSGQRHAAAGSANPPAASTPAGRVAGVIPALARLAPDLVAAIDRDAVAIERKPGSVLFDEGSSCAGLLLLESGRIRVSRSGAPGRELLLYRVAPGETCVLTVSCLLGRSAYPARGVAESAVRGVLLPAALFDRLAAASPEFRAFVFRAFSDRIESLVALAAAVVFENLDRRLARALLARMDATGRIELAATHQELADELGTVRERVSRLLEGFEARGAVELGRGRLTVRDRAALESIADGGREADAGGPRRG